MTFGMILAEHLTMAAYASMFYILVDYENTPNMGVAAGNVNTKIHHLFSKQEILGVCVTIAQLKTSGGLYTNWLLNNMCTILVIMIIKLILICLSNSCFNFFIKMKTKKGIAFRFPFF